MMECKSCIWLVEVAKIAKKPHKYKKRHAASEYLWKLFMKMSSLFFLSHLHQIKHTQHGEGGDGKFVPWVE